MLRFILDLATAVRVFFTCRTDLALEILALRQQVAVLKRKRPPNHPNELKLRLGMRVSPHTVGKYLAVW